MQGTIKQGKEKTNDNKRNNQEINSRKEKITI